MQEEKDENIKDCSKEVQFWDNGMEATKVIAAEYYKC